MPDHSTVQTKGWNSTQAYLFAVFCLVLGVALGYLFRGSAPSPQVVSAAGASTVTSQPAAQQQPDQAQQKEMLDRAVTPLLANLKNNPNDFDTVVKVANLYFDGQQYPDALKFYQRAAALQPQNADVLTDYGTSFWYTGDPDRAIDEFQTALKFEPGRASTLFNLGIVRWQGKMDPKGAIEAWEELLKKNPDYPEKQRLEELISRAKQHMKK
ncbi:MAG TPA: tetratricopeptide repeat protein [Candidatus Binatia bacterium]|nr:tetratricopeptide repeat protein [Candidatus Binatia bacterium]